MNNPTDLLFDANLRDSIHTLPTHQVCKVLRVSLDGLGQAEAETRLQRFGPNVIRRIKGKPLWIRFLANFTHLLAILLWVGGIVAFLALIPLALRGVRYRPSGVSAISGFFH